MSESTFNRTLTKEQEETLFSVFCIIGMLEESMFHIGMNEGSEKASEAAQVLSVCHKMMFDVLP